jgi:hypothetical protein
MCLDASSKSSSQANQTSTTTNTDLRVVGGPGSVNVSAQGSQVNLALTDAGAVADSFGFAASSLKGALDFATAADTSAATQVQSAMDIVTGASARIADAYTTAKAGEQKVLVGVALAIVGVVAVQALKKG